MALGCLTHESANGFLPTGGWGWAWGGDPDRGFTARQPGGWLFNILPYIELGALHDLGLGGNADGLCRMAETPVATFYCPTRRSDIAYPYVHSGIFYYYNRPSAIGRSDYAGSTGEATLNGGDGPTSYTDADGGAWTDAKWATVVGGAGDANGVIFRHSQCLVADITDGISNTYLIGERYMNPDYYATGTDADDDQGWMMGYDYDINRETNPVPDCAPRQDTSGESHYWAFGSAHAGGFNMAFCDGSVHWIGYSIDPEVHRRLGDRKDGLPIDGGKF